MDSEAAEANSKEAVLHVSALSAACSFDSLRDDSDLIAEGRYLGKSDPILVIPVVGGIDAAMYYTLNLTVAEARLPLLTWGNGPLLRECFVWRNATPALPWKTSP